MLNKPLHSLHLHLHMQLSSAPNRQRSLMVSIGTLLDKSNHSHPITTPGNDQQCLLPVTGSVTRSVCWLARQVVLHNQQRDTSPVCV